MIGNSNGDMIGIAFACWCLGGLESGRIISEFSVCMIVDFMCCQTNLLRVSLSATAKVATFWKHTVDGISYLDFSLS